MIASIQVFFDVAVTLIQLLMAEALHVTHLFLLLMLH